ncbi:glycoside hydrolase family 3 N-terminal domain-containing protein [Actinoallomurus sp. NPDC052308]|uniref:glycoside hydrolase family 3 N-terminal domain-containing protein n=1 Tax=Actinoallomurus sp. NPDC052308 TaxID=3155530 RepID=UPI0034443A55
MEHPDRPMTRRDALRAGLTVAALAPAPAALARPWTGLTPEQQAGQRVIFSYSGSAVPPALLAQIEAGTAAGVIFFADNVTSLDQVTAATRRLEAARKAGPVPAPLLLMTDQEGGRIRRLPGGPVSSQKEIGQASDPTAAAARAGTEAGRLLAGVGMNVNLAPVLDVHRVEGDFADRLGRSYSTDPAVCGRLGAAFVTAQQRAGVAATVKHFPGLGAAGPDENTDLRPVTLRVPRSVLRTVDEPPYAPAIAAGVRLVMPSWAVYPALDPARPAGLSPVVLGSLRGRLGFRGVTVSDAINAGGLETFGTYAERAVAAARAGMDLILVCSQRVADGQAVVSGLAGALRSGRLDRRAFDAARARVSDLRHRSG